MSYLTDTTLDKLEQIADQGSPMTYYEMGEGMYYLINEHVVPAMIERGLKKFGDRTFFVHVETGHDPVIKRGLPVPKVAADARLSMPLPNFEQQVYKYQGGELTPLWAIPDAEMCAKLRIEGAKLPYDEELSLEWVTNFYNGTYTRMSNEYNQNLKV